LLEQDLAERNYLKTVTQSCPSNCFQGRDENNYVLLAYRIKGEEQIRNASLAFERKGKYKDTSNYYTW